LTTHRPADLRVVISRLARRHQRFAEGDSRQNFGDFVYFVILNFDVKKAD
jgi:hypothetical protein